MADPVTTLRQIILADTSFDKVRVRTLCLMITATMEDHAEAEQLFDVVWDELGMIELAIAMEQSSRTISAWRDDALEAVDKMVKAALG